MTHHQKIATEVAMAGGTLAGFLASYSDDIVKTLVCSGIGAMTSFLVTLFLKWVFKKINK